MIEIYKIALFFLFLIICFSEIILSDQIDKDYILVYNRNYKGNYGIFKSLDSIPDIDNGSEPHIVSNIYSNTFEDRNIPSFYYTNPGYLIYNFHPTPSSNGSHLILIDSTYDNSLYQKTSHRVQSFLNTNDEPKCTIKMVDSINKCTSLKYDQCVSFINCSGSEPFFLFDNNLYRPSLIYGTPTNGRYYLDLIDVSSLTKTSYKLFLFSSDLVYKPIVTYSELLYRGEPDKNLFKSYSNVLKTPSNASYLSWVAYFPGWANIGSLTVDNSNSNHIKLIIPPPFSYTKFGNNDSKTILKITAPVSIYFNDIANDIFSFTNFHYNFGAVYPIITSSDHDTPKYGEVEFFKSPDYITIRISASDAGSGIQYIIINFYSAYSENIISSFKLSNMDLIEGDCHKGIYQISLPKYTIRSNSDFEIIDHAKNFNKTKLLVPFTFLNPMDIEQIFFEKNNVDVSESSIDNKMFIGLKNKTITDLVFEFVPTFGLKNEPSFISKWNPMVAMYEIQFTIPAHLPPGPLQYMLNPVEIDSSTFFSYLGNSTELNIYCELTDTIGPLVVNLYSENVMIPSNKPYLEVGFDIEFEDNLNGISQINITIGSSKDPLGFDFTYKIENNNSFKCSPRWNASVAQTYFITKMSTMDGKGYSTEYPNVNKVNPMMNIVEIGSNQLVVSRDVLPSDDMPPSLLNFEAIPRSITDQSNRRIYVEFTIGDTDSGVLLNSPSIYAISDTLNILSFPCYPEKKNNSIYHHVNFTCEILVPYLYGYPNGFLFQIHGIYDNNLNGNGFTLTDYHDPSAFLISVPSTGGDIPFIESVINKGSSITLFGFKFGFAPTIIYTSNTIEKFQNFSPTNFLNSGFITFIPDFTQSFIDETLEIYIQTSNGRSNSVSIALQCKGQPLCGGPSHGTCTLSGCVCNVKYTGVDCTLNIIVVDPNINTTKPDVELQYIQYQSLISIHSLREVDFNGKLVNEYVFDSWRYFSLNDSFSYLSNVSNKNEMTKNTDVQVLIKHFKDGGIVHFAGSDITILTGAIKYYITLSSYQFKNDLNTLQLVMLASIESLQGENACSSADFSNFKIMDDESQYLKVQINNVSLYGQFIKRALIDGKIVSITNKPLNLSEIERDGKNENSSNTGTNSKAYIAIEIPHFVKKAELDPNFSILLDNTDKPNLDNSVCAGGFPSKSGLTTPQIIGIVIAGVGILLLVGIIIGSIVYKKSTFIRVKAKSLSLKLKSIK
ncbi:hypothetical protein ACTA71_008017 [Dictyostelium dimigraforme]